MLQLPIALDVTNFQPNKPNGVRAVKIREVQQQRPKRIKVVGTRSQWTGSTNGGTSVEAAKGLKGPAMHETNIRSIRLRLE